MENTIKMANRYGLNLKLTNIKDENDTAVIDFANEVSLEISGEITWATGGQGHVKMIGFKDPKEGTLKISTQVTTMQVMQLLAGGKLTDKGNKVSFKDDGKIAFKYYKIEGDTVWKDEEGVVYNEKVTVYKALVKPNYSVTYNGSGDPTSIDIEFELAVDKEGNFVDIERSEATDEDETTENGGSEVTPDPDNGGTDPDTDPDGGDTNPDEGEGDGGEGGEDEGTENP